MLSHPLAPSTRRLRFLPVSVSRLRTLLLCGAGLSGFCFGHPAHGADKPALPAFVAPAWKPVAAADKLVFKLDPERLQNSLQSDRVLLAKDALARLPGLIERDPAVAKAWLGYETKARQLLADGRWAELKPEQPARYIYILHTWLPRLALLYTASGEPHLGQLVRALILDTARRPVSFWIHSDLRAYDPKRPVGGLETADLSLGVALTLEWAPEIFTAQETTEVRTALREKGLAPCLSWLEKPRPNNWLATLASGALVTARVLKDETAVATASADLQAWLGLTETDGSYGEPAGYYQYALTHFFMGWWSLGFETGRRKLAGQNLEKALPWFALHYVVHREAENSTGEAWKINLGDDDFKEGVNPFVVESLAYAYRDGVGTWMARHLGTDNQVVSINQLLLRLNIAPGELPAPVSPAERKLPTAGVYTGGLAIFRTGWTFDHDVLFALRSGGRGKTDYSHDRPNRNAFVLFVDGDYVLAAPGRASYRSPLRQSWDQRTDSHSAITLDGENQTAQPDSFFLNADVSDEIDYVESDATKSYPQKASNVLRQVWFLRPSGLVLIRDTITPNQSVAVGATLLLANHDHQSVLTRIADSTWRLKRPLSEIAFSVTSDHALTFSKHPGIMHTDYSYYPGDKGEGRPGSALQLRWTAEKSAEPVHIWTLILPRAREFPGLKIEALQKSAPDVLVGWKLITDLGEKMLLVKKNDRPAGAIEYSH